MILTLIINTFNFFLGFAASLLPVGSLPAIVSTALDSVNYYVNILSYILPTGTILGVLSIVIAYEALTWGWHAFLWIIKKLPIIGK